MKVGKMISANEAVVESLKNKEYLSKKRIEDMIKKSEGLLDNSIKNGQTSFYMEFMPTDYDLGNIVKTHYEYHGYTVSASFHEKRKYPRIFDCEENHIVYEYTISWEINDNT